MTAALMRSSYVETFQFSAGQKTVLVSTGDVVFISGGRLPTKCLTII